MKSAMADQKTYEGPPYQQKREKDRWGDVHHKERGWIIRHSTEDRR
ncbi:hypothetical protein BAXH7_00423 [Bacillus amyloliquefaciens XH7]|nr:hypothetical protein LL3_00420 [Bacillus amyloliquefaciens LL3]AEK87569.1 hypothetical protein BAXH7_00423 [Bacillus amyloliquefaciens XH7]